jgi:hypothetical protein
MNFYVLSFLIMCLAKSRDATVVTDAGLVRSGDCPFRRTRAGVRGLLLFWDRTRHQRIWKN